MPCILRIKKSYYTAYLIVLNLLNKSVISLAFSISRLPSSARTSTYCLASAMLLFADLDRMLPKIVPLASTPSRSFLRRYSKVLNRLMLSLRSLGLPPPPAFLETPFFLVNLLRLPIKYQLSVLLVTVAAVNWLITCWFERHLCLFATIRACYSMERSLLKSLGGACP